MAIQLDDYNLHVISQDEARREAFLEQMIAEYSQSILWLAFSYVKEQQLAEELMQDVFLTCYNKIEHFRNQSSIKTWTYRITINKCKDQLRKKTLKRFLMNEERNQDDFGVTTKDPEAITFAKMEDQQLADKVLALPTKFKEVIFMYDFEDMKVKEMSDILKLNQNTIKTRLNRGRNMLRNMYEEEGLDEH
ncbi:sigma-70 family RNA polymerase sigma factor [Thalassobacillus sp. CUG 92003]|uniref:sigma-70 family RNA polymerase sigma factor n=1 Tax=Thalassobacillus sp. CUG 92003 TaxID=2736641 RepID=UPI0015E72412|nr:sigma-70 family RNA polymerase sigma factor [Thalassobacillus sp. CUG 92003]